MSRKPSKLLAVGKQAPDFSLLIKPDRLAELGDYRGSPLVLLFYAADFEPVCTQQMVIFNEVLPEFHRFGAQVLGISPDSVWCHVAFGLHYNLGVPLLSDYSPRSQVARAYRVPIKDEEHVTSTIYVLDKSHQIVYSESAEPQIAIDAKGAFEAVENLAH